MKLAAEIRLFDARRRVREDLARKQAPDGFAERRYGKPGSMLSVQHRVARAIACLEVADENLDSESLDRPGAVTAVAEALQVAGSALKDLALLDPEGCAPPPDSAPYMTPKPVPSMQPLSCWDTAAGSVEVDDDIPFSWLDDEEECSCAVCA